MRETSTAGPDFLGLGAQKAATSWIYACLAEHPRIFMPAKEIHFFSRGANWSRGCDWYESLFSRRPPGAVSGEFSTSYLSNPKAADRIFRKYPATKLIACLRNPVERAVSNYMNDVMRGAADPDAGFLASLEQHPEYIEQGRYFEALIPYRERFDRHQMLFLIYEDIAVDPAAFLASIHRHLGVGEHRPSMLHRRVNVSRRPRSPFLERRLIRTSDWLRKAGLERIWWAAKKAGVGDFLRRINTLPAARSVPLPTPGQRRELYQLFQDDVARLSELLGRRLEELWRP